MALTKRQREVFDFISEFVEEQGYSPSLEEIAAQFGLSSVATVHRHVQHLVEKGMLRKAWNRSRSLEPVPQAKAEPAEDSGLTTLPLVGSVAAGTPIEAIEENEFVSVPSEMAGRPGQSFVLRVRGDSMIDDQICNGDLVVVEKRTEARNGQTVVAMIDGTEATLKRFYREGSEVKLVPANKTMEPMVFAAEQVSIQGIVRGLMRSF
ncbi:MAG: repressor LexA [Myxococcota bacterium]|jgi:repressor LexA